MTEVSVIIPTHNPDASRLQRVYAALAAQTLARSRWELVVVDNASRDGVPTPENWPSEIAFTTVLEPRLGLTHARGCGFAASKGGTLVLCDDDNVLDPNYLEAALAFMESHPAIGAAGGIITPEFASAPAKWATPHVSILALRNLGFDVLLADAAEAIREYPIHAPFGAGMVLRRNCFEQYKRWQASQTEVMSDRTGTHLGSCGDCEILVAGVFNCGLGVAYVPSLRLVHLIPASRLQFGYLVRLVYDGGISWGRFLVRHGYKQKISAWTIPLRSARAWFRQRAWTRAGYIGWRAVCGYFEGLAK